MRLIRLVADPMSVALAAEYESPEEVRRAARAMRERGYRRLDTYTPFDVEGLDEQVGARRTRIPIVTFACGALGAATGYLIQWFCNAVDFPINVGGRPMHSAPAFIPITFETMVLFASVGTFVAFFAACRLPELWNPLFEVEGFERASVDRYWLAVDERDPLYRPATTEEHLRATAPLRLVRLGEAA